MKKIIAFLLVLCMVLAMCACGSPGYGVNVVQTLVEQEYSLAFRVNDPLYFYVTAALSVLAAQGRVDALAIKWLGSPALNFEKQADALEVLQPPEPQDLIVGVDINSFPMAYVSNGEYWGLYAFRELHSAEHYATYMDVPADTVTKITYTTEVASSISDLYRSLNRRNFRNQNDWEYVKSILDLESFADWIIFEAYTGNFDINENMRYYYSTADGKWRCGLVDVDLGFFRNDAFTEVASSFHHGKLVSALLTNPEFKEMVALRLAELLKGPLSDKSVQETIDMLADTIDSEIYLEAERWGYSYELWETFTNRLRKFCKGRAKYMINDFCAVVGYGAGSKQQFFGHLIG